MVIAFSVIPFFSSNEYLLAGLTLSLAFVAFIRTDLKMDVKYAGFLAILAIFLVIQGAMIRSFSIRSIVGSLTRFTFPFLVITIYKDRFTKTFINVVYGLTLIGLVIFVLKNLFPSVNSVVIMLGRTLPFDEVSRQNFIIYSSRGGERFMGIISNSAFAYEPGAYSVILTIALVFIQAIHGSVMNKKGVILLTALLTTFSTAGYVGLFVILFGYALDKVAGRGVFRGIFLLIMLIITMPFVLQTSFMGEKIESQIELAKDPYQTLGRFASARADIQLWLTNPIFGVGKGEENFDGSVFSYGFGSTHRVNGLANFLAKFGVVVFAIYLYFMYDSLKRLFVAHNKSGNVLLYYVALLSVAFAQTCLQWSAFIALIYIRIVADSHGYVAGYSRARLPVVATKETPETA